MYDLSAGAWAVSIVAGLCVGLSKAGVAGMGIVVVPMMASIFPAAESVGILLPMLIAGDLLGVSYYRRHAVWREIGKAMPLLVAGVIFGFVFMKYVTFSDAGLKQFIGGVVLLMLALGQWQKSRNSGQLPAMHWSVCIFLGLLGGFTTMTANAAGPVMTLYLLYLGLQKNTFIGTGAWLFLIINLFKFPFQWELGSVTGQSLLYDLLLVPLILIGFVAGIKLIHWIPQKAFHTFVTIMVALAAVKLLLS